MKSVFHHQHAVDYLNAWNKLADACTFRAPADQIKIIEAAKNSVNAGRKCRGGDGAGFTDTEMAMIAACDHHLTMRANLGPNVSLDVITVVDDDSMTKRQRTTLMNWFANHPFSGR